MKNQPTEVNVDSFTLKLTKGQINVYDNSTGRAGLVRAIDVKDINNDKEEFEQFTNKFKAACAARSNK